MTGSATHLEKELTVEGVRDEQFITTLQLKDARERPFSASFFKNLKGYTRGEQAILCQDCEQEPREPAIFRVELQSIEPQGSEYFGLNHKPQVLIDNGY